MQFHPNEVENGDHFLSSSKKEKKTFQVMEIMGLQKGPKPLDLIVERPFNFLFSFKKRPFNFQNGKWERQGVFIGPSLSDRGIFRPSPS